jgi:hypothetical protein
MKRASCECHHRRCVSITAFVRPSLPHSRGRDDLLIDLVSPCAQQTCSCRRRGPQALRKGGEAFGRSRREGSRLAGNNTLGSFVLTVGAKMGELLRGVASNFASSTSQARCTIVSLALASSGRSQRTSGSSGTLSTLRRDCSACLRGCSRKCWRRWLGWRQHVGSE